MIFTFQSGDIQILQSAKATINKNKFTFQSGDIQIHSLHNDVYRHVRIYIPIW